MHIVTLLVDRGADVNAQQHGGWTALHAAAFIDDLPMAEYVVAHGADTSLTSDDGKTPIDVAAGNFEPARSRSSLARRCAVPVV